MMALNHAEASSNGTAQGLGSFAFQALQNANLMTMHYIGIAAAVVLLSLLYHFSPPRLDPREPPMLKPGFPLVGHIVGLVRHGVDYFELLRQSQRSPAALATLPMANRKVYVLWDAPLINAALRHKNLTFDILSMEFAQRVFGLSDTAMKVVWGPDGDIATSIAPRTLHLMKGAMQGQHLYRMNASALKYISDELNGMSKDGSQIPNLYRWLRRFMTLATSEGIYGNDNPIRHDESLIDALWEFDSNIQPLFLGILPKLIARKAYVNREKVQAALVPWYLGRKDEADDVAEITKLRASSARDFGFPEEEVGKLELALLFVATTNTIPTLYWFVVNVWVRPELVEAIRRETLPLVKLAEARPGDKDRRLATVDITQLEEHCPLMVSCYRESIRLSNQAVGTRRVMHDTLLTDENGTSYLLKAGVDVMWSIKSLHRSSDTWGPDSLGFDAARFQEQDKFGRQKKQSYIPFGGGRHLCPGRNFAFAENLGFMAALVVGFHLEGLDAANIRMGSASMGEAVAKPPADAEGGAVVVKRRDGWEDVDWAFVC